MLDKLEKFLFYFLFFAIPFQARKILYSPGWYFNEWQSVSIYATDIFLIVLFGFWVYRGIQSWQISNFKFLISKQLPNYLITKLPKYDYFLFSFLFVALVSVKNSSDFYSGFFLWLKLVEFVAFYFYLKTYAIKKFNFVLILYALIIGGLFQAVIAIAQFLKQGDLGLMWLGESVLGPHMTGIASFLVTSGEKVIRAYGTTPHPNILAAYLFLSIAAFYFVVFYVKPSKYLYLGYFIILLGLFASFSRTVVFLFFVNFLARGFLMNFIDKFRSKFLTKEFLKDKIYPIFFTTILAVVVFGVIYWPEVSTRIRLSSEEEAVQLRIFYNKESLGGGINLFGIGLGDFTGWLMEQNPNLPRHFYQPVHNVYLLIYSEIGVLGFIFFLLFLVGLIYEFIKKTKLQELWHYSFLLVVVSILFIGLFDHFLITLQQGRFVLWLGLTMLAIGDIMKSQSTIKGVDMVRRTKRENRIRRERHRHGTPNQGHGWAAKQAAKHSGRGRSTSVRKVG